VISVTRAAVPFFKLLAAISSKKKNLAARPINYLMCMVFIFSSFHAIIILGSCPCPNCYTLLKVIYIANTMPNKNEDKTLISTCSSLRSPPIPVLLQNYLVRRAREMEALFSAAVGELVSRCLSFLISRYPSMPELSKVESLRKAGN